jgi:4-hydroxy-2-oxoheptanedioate aldolase
MRISRIAALLGAGLALPVMIHAGAPPSTALHLNKVIAKLERKELVTGIWVSSLDPSNALGLVRSNGFPSAEKALAEPMIDFILIDMEHTPFDVARLRSFLLGLSSKREVMVKGNLQPNLIPLVRIPPDGDQPLHAAVKQVLDVGVFGVVVPHVCTATQARRIVHACRYAQPTGDPHPQPAGKRGASPILAAYLWGLTLEEYAARADVWPLDPRGDLLAVVMIEDPEGVQNIDAILSVPGIGACIFGPYDYSFSSGHYGDTTHRDVLAAGATVKAACDRHGIPLIGFADPKTIHDRLRENYRMLLIGSDMDYTGGHGTVLDILRQEGTKKQDVHDR